MALALLALPSTGRAYTISTEVSEGCHEGITGLALRTVRGELATAAPLATTDNEEALVDDLQFVPDADMRDLGGATLLAAVRDNDLKGRASDDLSALAEVHGDPNAQQEHCLRRADQKEPGGSRAAVETCRAFIRDRARLALDGLDAQGAPDLNRRTELTIYLSLRGTVRAPLPTYYVAAGQAIHAIEDSFTHTYRTPDGKKITVVLNWLDEVNGTLVESRDGPAHAKELDRCDDPDALRKTRRLLATAAATQFLRVTLDPKKTREEKLAAVDDLLDTYVAYEPGCTFENHWCDAPERQYQDSTGCSCGLGKIGEGDGALLVVAVVLALGMGRRARRRRRAARGLAMLGSAFALSLGGGEARAEERAPTTTTTTTTPSEDPSAPPTTATVTTTPTVTTTTVKTPTKEGERAVEPPTVIPVKQPGPANPHAVTLGAYAGFSGSLQKPAMAGALGARLRVSKSWTFGLDGEWNPWIAFNGARVRGGVANLYGTAMLRFPLAYENFNLRVGVSAGASYLLIDLYGAPSGSVGLYLGASPLSVEWKLSRIFYLIINPLHFAMPIPQLQGVPLLYPQYRSTIGLEIYAG